MANDSDMSGWSDILHSSSKLLEQATPSAQFPPLQRNLDQLELLSKKIKAKTLQTEAPSQSIAATRHGGENFVKRISNLYGTLSQDVLHGVFGEKEQPLFQRPKKDNSAD